MKPAPPVTSIFTPTGYGPLVTLLVIGAYGQLGFDLLRVAREVGVDAVGVDRDTVDITQPQQVRECLAAVNATAIINCAAYTAVDAQEADEAAAHLLNGAAPGFVAAAAVERGIPLIHISTDYVFPGDRTDGLGYQPGDPTGPRSAYGRTKLAGEVAVREIAPDLGWVVRTAWVYGQNGNNFVKTMAKLLQERDSVAVVTDEIGSPTWSYDLARGLVALAQRSRDLPAQILHATGVGEPVSWWGFTRAIAEELGIDVAKVGETTAAAFNRPAPRPSWSVLSPEAWDSLGLPPMLPWRDALHEAFADPAIRAALAGS
jgi:dTDP-4-dehydrorhamnose reductase